MTVISTVVEDVIVYATGMDPEFWTNVLGRPAKFEYDLVYVVEAERSITVASIPPTGKFNEVFNDDGSLKSAYVGNTTVDRRLRKTFKRFNAVAYRGIQLTDFRKLALAEKASNFGQWSIHGPDVISFETGERWKGTSYWPIAFRANQWYDVQITPNKVIRYRHVREDVLPEPKYLEKIRKAARIHGPSFEDALLDLTRIGDGRTLRQYIND